MKVLWVTNTIFPKFSKVLQLNVPVVGGWMYGLANAISSNGVELIVATARPNVKPINKIIDGIEYYLLNSKKPSTEYDLSLEKQWLQIIDKTKPELVHIHGTEYAFGLSLLKSCPNLNYVISIQGLISVYSRYYSGAIPDKVIKKYATFRDFIKRDGILNAQKKFHHRGEHIEKRYFKLANQFIGRTEWDFHHTFSLNNKATYHFCNESLRDVFYESPKWNITAKKDFSIFLSQAIYPIKGLHMVLKAVSLIKEKFPSIKLRVSGANITQNTTFKDKLRLGGYGNYLNSLIDKNSLHNHIEFTGLLNAEQMVKEYLKCHVFICPSSIENSPNSLGEAQLLGTPTIASYVGGVPDMVNHKENGLLYRYEEYEMLAQQITEIFKNDNLALKLSEKGIESATFRHNQKTNLKNTLDIYKKIINS